MTITTLDAILKKEGWIKYAFIDDSKILPQTSETAQTLTKNNIPYLVLKDTEVVLNNTTSLYVRAQDLDKVHALFRKSHWTGD